MPHAEKIHGYRVMASCLTGRVDTDRSCEASIVLVDRGDGYPDRYVTGFHWIGDREWSTGNYFTDLNRALDDFMRRVRNELGVKQ